MLPWLCPACFLNPANITGKLYTCERNNQISGIGGLLLPGTVCEGSITIA